MSALWFDCFSGVSGDMILGALVDLGLDVASWRDELRSLPVPFDIEVDRAMRGGIACARVVVRADETTAHRTLADVRAIVDGSALPEAVRRDAMRVFERLAAAEAAVHGTTAERVAFHEVGAVDAIVDIAGAVSALARLDVRDVFVSSIAVGRHRASTAHGTIPTPAPATLALLDGLPVVWTEIAEELATPTGVALLATLGSFAPPPTGRVRGVGYGAGGRDPAGRPNALRVVRIEPAADVESGLWQLDANIDDMSPEHVGAAFAPLLEAGALDVWTTAVTMKKGRPGLRLSALCDDRARAAVVDRILRATTTFGVRATRVERTALEREVRAVETPWGPVRVKVGRLRGEVCQVAPEHDDVARAAAAGGVSPVTVADAARAAWRALCAKK